MPEQKTVEHIEEIDGSKIEYCPEGKTIEKPVYTQSDSKGNKFEIFCKDGAYQGIFTPNGGKPVYVGRCKYRLGHNTIKKKLLSTFTVNLKLDRACP